ncbi:unnamed protein product [Sympodiomycopsis kandeliae]
MSSELRPRSIASPPSPLPTQEQQRLLEEQLELDARAATDTSSRIFYVDQSCLNRLLNCAVQSSWLPSEDDDDDFIRDVIAHIQHPNQVSSQSSSSSSSPLSGLFANPIGQQGDAIEWIVGNEAVFAKPPESLYPNPPTPLPEYSQRLFNYPTTEPKQTPRVARLLNHLLDHIVRVWIAKDSHAAMTTTATKTTPTTTTTTTTAPALKLPHWASAADCIRFSPQEHVHLKHREKTFDPDARVPVPVATTVAGAAAPPPPATGDSGNPPPQRVNTDGPITPSPPILSPAADKSTQHQDATSLSSDRSAPSSRSSNSALGKYRPDLVAYSTLDFPHLRHHRQDSRSNQEHVLPKPNSDLLLQQSERRAFFIDQVAGYVEAKFPRRYSGTSTSGSPLQSLASTRDSIESPLASGLSQIQTNPPTTTAAAWRPPSQPARLRQPSPYQTSSPSLSVTSAGTSISTQNKEAAEQLRLRILMHKKALFGVGTQYAMYYNDSQFTLVVHNPGCIWSFPPVDAVQQPELFIKLVILFASKCWTFTWGKSGCGDTILPSLPSMSTFTLSCYAHTPPAFPATLILRPGDVMQLYDPNETLLQDIDDADSKNTTQGPQTEIAVLRAVDQSAVLCHPEDRMPPFRLLGSWTLVVKVHLALSELRRRAGSKDKTTRAESDKQITIATASQPAQSSNPSSALDQIPPPLQLQTQLQPQGSKAQAVQARPSSQQSDSTIKPASSETRTRIKLHRILKSPKRLFTRRSSSGHPSGEIASADQGRSDSSEGSSEEDTASIIAQSDEFDKRSSNEIIWKLSWPASPLQEASIMDVLRHPAIQEKLPIQALLTQPKLLCWGRPSLERDDPMRELVRRVRTCSSPGELLYAAHLWREPMVIVQETYMPSLYTAPPHALLAAASEIVFSLAAHYEVCGLLHQDVSTGNIRLQGDGTFSVELRDRMRARAEAIRAWRSAGQNHDQSLIAAIQKAEEPWTSRKDFKVCAGLNDLGNSTVDFNPQELQHVNKLSPSIARFNRRITPSNAFAQVRSATQVFWSQADYAIFGLDGVNTQHLDHGVESDIESLLYVVLSVAEEWAIDVASSDVKVKAKTWIETDTRNRKAIVVASDIAPYLENLSPLSESETDAPQVAHIKECMREALCDWQLPCSKLTSNKVSDEKTATRKRSKLTRPADISALDESEQKRKYQARQTLYADVLEAISDCVDKIWP